VFTHITACRLADLLSRPFAPEASAPFVAEQGYSDCYRRSESCRVGFLLPHWSLALPRRTEKCRL